MTTPIQYLPMLADRDDEDAPIIVLATLAGSDEDAEAPALAAVDGTANGRAGLTTARLAQTGGCSIDLMERLLLEEVERGHAEQIGEGVWAPTRTLLARYGRAFLAVGEEARAA